MKNKKIITTVAVISLICGSILIGIGLVMGGSLHALRISLGFDTDGFHLLQYTEDVTRTERNLGLVTSLTIDMDLGNVTVVEGDGDGIRVQNLIEDRYTLEEYEDEAVLKLKDRTRFSFFNFGATSTQDIKIILPRDYELAYLEIHNSMGDIDLRSVSAKSMRIVANMGTIEGTDMKTEGLYVENDMGDIKLEGIFHNDTVVDNSMGSIRMTVLDDMRKYDYRADCSLGTVRVNGEKGRNSQILQNENTLTLDNSMGDISLNFNR